MSDFFKPDDFQLSAPEHLRTHIAERANAKLLDLSIPVRGLKNEKGLWNFGEWEIRQDTHSARLFQITELKPAKCEHNLDWRETYWPKNVWQCGLCKRRITWTAVE